MTSNSWDIVDVSDLQIGDIVVGNSTGPDWEFRFVVSSLNPLRVYREGFQSQEIRATSWHTPKRVLRAQSYDPTQAGDKEDDI